MKSYISFYNIPIADVYNNMYTKSSLAVDLFELPIAVLWQSDKVSRFYLRTMHYGVLGVNKYNPLVNGRCNYNLDTCNKRKLLFRRISRYLNTKVPLANFSLKFTTLSIRIWVKHYGKYSI